MSNHRYSKFWWQDWQRDGALRMCSLSARGLWMELLCLAHDGVPTGHVTVNGKRPTNRQLATIVGATEKDVAKLLTELEEAGVFSRTNEGVIFSRRMVRDAGRSEEGKGHASKRWHNGHTPNGPPNGSPISEPTGLPDEHLMGSPQGTPILNRSEAESDRQSQKELRSSLTGNSRARGDELPPETRSVGQQAVGNVVSMTRKAFRPTAYPPGRKPPRTADEQIAAATERRPKAAALTGDRLAEARRLAGVRRVAS